MSLLDPVVAWMRSIPPPAGVGLVFFVAGGKYVFPPVPTDTIAIVAAFLVGSAGWPLIPLVLAYLLGSFAGILGAQQLGRWLQTRERWGWLERFRPALVKVVDQFRDRGLPLVAANRFIPVMRDFALIAAGLARMPVRSVTFWAMVSVAAWASVVFGVGATAGKNWDAVMDRFSSIGTVTWVLLAVIVVGVVIAHRVRNFRTPKLPPPPPSPSA